MVEFRLANVLLSDAPRSDDYPNLYFRTTPAVVAGEQGVTVSNPDASRLDFATYLNGFSYVKWREYTSISNVWLHIRARGTFTFEPCGYTYTTGDPKREVFADEHYSNEDYTDIEFEFPVTDAQMVAFHLVCEGKVEIEEAYYYTKIDEREIRDIELALAITTYKKEDFIERNLGIIRDKLLSCDEPVADHLTVHVSDNGRTLDTSKLESDRIHIHPNINAGGSGGFARGMIEALEQTPKATHVLLMDDDVEILPEAIKRTFNVLALANDEYKNAFVSGAMMAYEEQDFFSEDTGFVQWWGPFGALKADDKVDTVKQVMRIECVKPHAHNHYAGWWYCCIPVATIEEKGLPLPLFVRGDDVEYGLRCAPKFITMNGICIWHLAFADKFRTFYERYQFNRNVLIAQSASGVCPDVDFYDYLNANIQLDLKQFSYNGVEMALRALEDYMKGPDYLASLDHEALMQELSKKNDQLVPIEEIDDERVRMENFEPETLYEDMRQAYILRRGRTLLQRAYDYGTQNGQRFVPKALQGDKLAVLSYDGWAYAPDEIRGAGAVLFVSRDGARGILNVRDNERYKELSARLKEDKKLYEAKKDELREAYAEAFPRLTSAEFWKSYLGIEGE